MNILLAGSSSYAQFIAVTVVFILVLVVTCYVSKWMGTYQKKTNPNLNVEVVECTRIANNKFIEIVRVGNSYRVLAICKDTVTDLGVIDESEIKVSQGGAMPANFKDIFDKLKNGNKGD